MGFWSSLQTEQFLYKYVNNNAQPHWMLYVVSLSVGIYLFLSLESSQIWKHYLIIVVKFSCFLRPSPVALPWGIKKIKAFAYGQHWLEWAACHIWAQLILARCCPEQAAHRQHQPWYSLCRLGVLGTKRYSCGSGVTQSSSWFLLQQPQPMDMEVWLHCGWF